MPTAAELEKLLQPLFPGLMGVEIEVMTPEKIVAGMTVRADLCTAGGVCHGGALMAFADTVAGGVSPYLPAGVRGRNARRHKTPREVSPLPSP